MYQVLLVWTLRKMPYLLRVKTRLGGYKPFLWTFFHLELIFGKHFLFFRNVWYPGMQQCKLMNVCPSKPHFYSCQIKKWRLPWLRSTGVRNIEMAALLLNKIGQGSKFKPAMLCVCMYACTSVYVRVCLWAWMSQLCGIPLSIIM